MSEWVSVGDRLPAPATKGVHDSFPVLICAVGLCSEVTEYNMRVCTWMNNSFSGYPSGATVVTHWQPLPPPPEQTA